MPILNWEHDLSTLERLRGILIFSVIFKLIRKTAKKTFLTCVYSTNVAMGASQVASRFCENKRRWHARRNRMRNQSMRMSSRELIKVNG